MAKPHVMQSVSMLVDAQELQVQLQSRLAARQPPPHEMLLSICLDSRARHVALFVRTAQPLHNECSIRSIVP